jgi:acid stress-induced BolA-like protein IbaG/YrbA
MAVTLKTEIDAPPAFVTRLASALEDQIPQTQVSFEPLNSTGWYRFLVVSSTFEPLGFLEQQDRVWAVADSVLSPDEQHFVSMIVTVTPDEVRP